TRLRNDLATVARMPEMHDEISRRERTRAALGPFDEHEGTRRPEVGEPEPFELARVRDAVEIEVMRIERTGAIRLDQAVGWALDALTDAERRQQRARKRRLAGAEFAFEVDDAALIHCR